MELSMTVHTTAPVNKTTGKQVCVRCGEQLHEVNLSALPPAVPLGNELSKPEAHCYAPGVNVIVQSPPLLLGEFVEGQSPAIGEFCPKAKKEK